MWSITLLDGFFLFVCFFIFTIWRQCKYFLFSRTFPFFFFASPAWEHHQAAPPIEISIASLTACPNVSLRANRSSVWITRVCRAGVAPPPPLLRVEAEAARKAREQPGQRVEILMGGLRGGRKKWTPSIRVHFVLGVRTSCRNWMQMVFAAVAFILYFSFPACEWHHQAGAFFAWSRQVIWAEKSTAEGTFVCFSAKCFFFFFFF